MKRILLILCILFQVTISTYAIDKQVLADTLTQIAQSHAYVGKVTVSRIRVRNSHIHVYTNATLSHISFTASEVRDIRSLVSQLVLGNNQGKVTIYSENMELGELITNKHKTRPSNMRYTLDQVPAWVRNISHPYSTHNGLSGKHIALWGSHGRYYHQTMEQWLWQRAKLWTTVEDVYTSSYTMPFLVPMLENAGAVVVQPRERDTQEVEDVVDEIEAIRRLGEEAKGKWVKGEGTGWGEDNDEVLLEGENPFEKGGYMVAPVSSKETILLRYTPHPLPTGLYAVYVSYKSLPNSTKAARYTVVHRGQKTEFEVNQQMGGGTWVYLGTFAFDSDPNNNYVTLSNAGKGNAVVTADAVKFGGGIGNVARYPQPDKVENTPSSQDIQLRENEVDSAQLLANQQWAETSGMPRYLEAARYWMQYAGIPDSIYNYTASRNDYTDDYCCRGMWVNYLAGGSQANPKQAGLGVPLHLSLAFHSDAGVKRDSIIGTLMIYTDFDNDKSKTYPTGVSRQLARDYGDYMQSQIVNDVRALYAPHWMRRHLQNSSYAEARYPKVPAVLLELLSHQNYDDMRYGLDPRVKFTISRAIYKGMLRFIHAQYGTELVVQPLPVQQMAMKRLGERLEISWEATEDVLEPTAKPTYYVVYTRQDDGDWDNGVRVKNKSYIFTPTPGTRYDIKVQAGNAGGVSMPSEVLSAYFAPEEKGRVLVLNAFTRVSGPDWFEDSTYVGIHPRGHGVGYGKDISYIGEQFDFDTRHPWITDDECGWGSCYCDQQATLTMGNTFDYPVLHGKALAEMGYSYISANAYAIDTIADVDAVDLIMGKQKLTILGTDTAFKSFTPELQKVVANYLAKGGNLLVSGAYIASDMQSPEDKAFVKNQLHYTYRCNHACEQGSLVVNRRILSPATYTFQSAPNAEHIHTENPDCILPADGAQAVAKYADTQLNAAVAYDGREEQKGKTLAWGFMLESTQDFNTLYKDCINWLLR
jgi:hypothetical protein